MNRRGFCQSVVAVATSAVLPMQPEPLCIDTLVSAYWWNHTPSDIPRANLIKEMETAWRDVYFKGVKIIWDEV